VVQAGDRQAVQAAPASPLVAELVREDGE
jgi:hypothetical protein